MKLAFRESWLLYCIETENKIRIKSDQNSKPLIKIENSFDRKGRLDVCWKNVKEVHKFYMFSYMFSISFRKHREEKNKKNLLTLIIKM